MPTAFRFGSIWRFSNAAAIANVYEEAKRYDPDAAKINPMELWDLHHIRRIDDIGFVKALYRQNIDPRVATNSWAYMASQGQTPPTQAAADPAKAAKARAIWAGEA